MGKLLRKCVKCGQYTMGNLICSVCGGETINPNPSKFSLTDKYGKYRREVKKMDEKEKGDF